MTIEGILRTTVEIKPRSEGHLFNERVHFRMDNKIVLGTLEADSMEDAILIGSEDLKIHGSLKLIKTKESGHPARALIFYPDGKEDDMDSWVIVSEDYLTAGV